MYQGVTSAGAKKGTIAGEANLNRLNVNHGKISIILKKFHATWIEQLLNLFVYKLA